jgi:aldehyde:ferredoxin oxidoreductase
MPRLDRPQYCSSWPKAIQEIGHGIRSIMGYCRLPWCVYNNLGLCYFLIQDGLVVEPLWKCLNKVVGFCCTQNHQPY